MRNAIKGPIADDLRAVINTCGEVQDPTGCLDQIVEINHFVTWSPEKGGACSVRVVLARPHNLKPRIDTGGEDNITARQHSQIKGTEVAMPYKATENIDVAKARFQAAGRADHEASADSRSET